MKEYLAVDIGASSGRHILGRVKNGIMILEEVYRFGNGYQYRNGHKCWDVDALYAEVLKGLKACGGMGRIPVTMGIDTWGVDYVLLDAEGKRLDDAVAYRDKRTAGMDALIEKLIPFSQLYARTGIQKQSFNTIYQLTAQMREDPSSLELADRLLLIPDYLNYCLTGQKVNEYTNATTSALVNAKNKDWDWALLQTLGIKTSMFNSLQMPGHSLGGFTDDVQQAAGLDCRVILPATHDTGSAFLAVPAKDENAVYISSGTWSLLGIEQTEPNTSIRSMEANFTNEGGYQGRFRFLKNIMGLWMIQSIRRNYEEGYSFAELEGFARENVDFHSVINVNDQRFLAPENMLSEVQAACKETRQDVPHTPGEVMQCVYRSLAKGYKQSIRELESITGKTFTSINIVGGGSKDGYLNQLTAQETGLPVYAGPTEGTALGNLMVQMLSDGVYKDLQEARDAIKKSFKVEKYMP